MTKRLCVGKWPGFCLIWLMGLLLGMAVGVRQAAAQGVTTTTVQGTVFFANGTPGSGTFAGELARIYDYDQPGGWRRGARSSRSGRMDS